MYTIYSIYIYILSCVKWITGKKFLCNTGSTVCDDLGGGMGEGREAEEGGDICIFVADLHYC